jgi:hypothetical protein
MGVLRTLRDRIVAVGITERFVDSIRLFVWALTGKVRAVLLCALAFLGATRYAHTWVTYS